MIFRVDPEDGDRRDLVVASTCSASLIAVNALSSVNSGSAEQARLLSRDDGDGAAIGEQRTGLARLRRA